MELTKNRRAMYALWKEVEYGRLGYRDLDDSHVAHLKENHTYYYNLASCANRAQQKGQWVIVEGSQTYLVKFENAENIHMPRYTELCFRNFDDSDWEAMHTPTRGKLIFIKRGVTIMLRPGVDVSNRPGGNHRRLALVNERLVIGDRYTSSEKAEKLEPVDLGFKLDVSIHIGNEGVLIRGVYYCEDMPYAVSLQFDPDETKSLDEWEEEFKEGLLTGRLPQFGNCSSEVDPLYAAIGTYSYDLTIGDSGQFRMFYN